MRPPPPLNRHQLRHQDGLPVKHTGCIDSLQSPMISGAGSTSVTHNGRKSFPFVPLVTWAEGSTLTIPLSAPALGGPPRNGVAFVPGWPWGQKRKAATTLPVLMIIRHRLPLKKDYGVMQRQEDPRLTVKETIQKKPTLERWDLDLATLPLTSYAAATLFDFLP